MIWLRQWQFAALKSLVRILSPLQVINRLGKEINHPDSVYYWAWKNDIPVSS